jgi:hypothetical protein
VLKISSAFSAKIFFAEEGGLPQKFEGFFFFYNTKNFLKNFFHEKKHNL